MSKPRIIAFYLPQFHPFKENDEWWGKGFTEWTNVGKAKPLFKGHDQPRIPTELGYYDLRMPEIRLAQAEMAKEAGIEGFMYWHYWFGNGKTLLGNIFHEVLVSGEPNFPFCLGWANHSWYAKTWNKTEISENRLLIEQTYPGEEDARMYFESLLPAFRDNRYIKVDGRPLFYVFDPINIPDTYILWFKQWIQTAGFPGIYLVANISKTFLPKESFLDRGFDAVTYQRQLSDANNQGITNKSLLIRGGRKALRLLRSWLSNRPPYMESYRIAAQSFCTEMEKQHDVIPTVMPQWDHTPRSGWYGILLVDAKPEYFKEVMKKAISYIKHKPQEQQIIFLKSWNEWGEGNYMEPDLSHGRGYLTALKEALSEHDAKR